MPCRTSPARRDLKSGYVVMGVAAGSPLPGHGDRTRVTLSVPGIVDPGWSAENPGW